TPAIAKNHRTRTYYEYGSLRHYKGECPIVKFHKRVDMIHGRVRASKPKTMQDAIENETKLMNKKISTIVECQTEKRRAPVDSVVVALTTADQAPSAEETEPFETDESAATPPPHPTYRTTARISIPALVPMPAWTDSEVVRLLAISS
nr:hypothetical protein [Tanacetum cinerariifolium]